MKQLITLLMRSGLSLEVPQSRHSIERRLGQSMGMVSRAIEESHARQLTAPEPAGSESAAGEPAPGGRAAATTSTPEPKVQEVQAVSALERLWRMRPEENANAPDGR